MECHHTTSASFYLFTDLFVYFLFILWLYMSHMIESNKEAKEGVRPKKKKKEEEAKEKHKNKTEEEEDDKEDEEEEAVWGLTCCLFRARR